MKEPKNKKTKKESKRKTSAMKILTIVTQQL